MAKQIEGQNESVEGAAAPAATASTKYNLNNLNTLAVVSIATALTGFGAVAGVITGHVALSQLKTDGKSGRGLAIAGLAVGYAGIGLGVLMAVGRAALGIWGVRNGIEFGSHGNQGGFGNQDGFGGGMMGQWGQDDQNGSWSQGGFGGHMGNQNGWNNQNNFGGGMMVPGTPDTGSSTAPSQQNN